jgi:hypothetical protein
MRKVGSVLDPRHLVFDRDAGAKQFVKLKPRFLPEIVTGKDWEQDAQI